MGLARGTRAYWCPPGPARWVAAGSNAPSRCHRVHPMELSGETDLQKPGSIGSHSDLLTSFPQKKLKPQPLSLISPVDNEPPRLYILPE